MTTWSRGVAVLAASLMLVGGARAQSAVQPTPYGAARAPEPAPIGPSRPQPALIAGPITPLDAPPGPPSYLSLSTNHTGAFQAEDFPPEQAFFASFGMQGLTRSQPGSKPLVYFNPGAVDDGVVPVNLRRLGLAQSLEDIDPDMSFGVRGEFGYLYNGHIAEFSFFYLYPNTVFRQTESQGRLFTPFINIPAGFEGNNGIFLQADQVRTSYTTALWNAELNYRYSNLAVTDCEIIMGLRYTQLSEDLEIISNDDGLIFRDVFDRPDPLRVGIYRSAARNRIVAPQLGFEFHHAPAKWFSFGMYAKGAWGVNFAENQQILRRAGDQLVGADYRHSEGVFSHLYELCFFSEFHILERMKFRAGYNLLWLCQVLTADKQLNFDLSPRVEQPFNHDGNAFFNGPQLQFMFLF